MRINGAGVKSDVAGVLIDVTESWEGYNALLDATALTYPACDGRQEACDGRPHKIFTGVVTGGITPAAAYDATLGCRLITAVSGANEVGRGVVPTSAETLQMPLGQRFSVAGAIPIPFRRPLRSYTLLMPCRLPAIAGAAAFAGLAQQNGGWAFAGGFPNIGAVGWTASPGLNGGRYTPQSRQNNAAALVTGPDSGILGNAVDWHQLGIRYTEGPVPLIEWLMDGVPVHAMSGDANMPNQTGSTAGYHPCIATDIGAGTTIQNAACRFIVAELGS